MLQCVAHNRSMAKILMVASEATPFVKTGGLADVIGALPPALRERGEEVAVVLPKYRGVVLENPARVYDRLQVWAGSLWTVSIDRVIHRGVPFFFIDCPPLFDRAGIYNENGTDYPDNHIRFSVLCQAALGVLRHLFRADILHCHDWQAGLVGPYLRHVFRGDPTFFGTKLITTIHNLGYQGIFTAAQLEEVGLGRELFSPAAMEFYGDINLLKGGIVYADAITTVSPRYAQEIQSPEHGFRLDGLLRSRRDRLFGILNGVDYAEWSPEVDPLIPARYSHRDLSGKLVCKRALLQEIGLPSDNLDRPLIGIVSRFATQKGFDLIADIAEAVSQEDVSFAILGSGEARFEEMFLHFKRTRPDKFGVRVGYDNSLAHRIEAGADIFLMPSQYEPCGLNQIYSLRYGTVPVVRATGGLDDTIDPSTGFKFSEYSGQALLNTIRIALAKYQDHDSWRNMMVKGMLKDYSWNASAGAYSALYKYLISLELAIR